MQWAQFPSHRSASPDTFHPASKKKATEATTEFRSQALGHHLFTRFNLSGPSVHSLLGPCRTAPGLHRLQRGFVRRGSRQRPPAPSALGTQPGPRPARPDPPSQLLIPALPTPLPLPAPPPGVSRPVPPPFQLLLPVPPRCPRPWGGRGRLPESGRRWRRPRAGRCWPWRCVWARRSRPATPRASGGTGRPRRRTFGTTMTRTWPGCWSSGRCGRRRGWRGPAAPRGGSAAAAGGRRGRAGAAAALPGAGKAGDGSPGPGGRGPRAWWRMAGAVFLPPRLWVRVGGFQSRGERPHPALPGWPCPVFPEPQHPARRSVPASSLVWLKSLVFSKYWEIHILWPRGGYQEEYSFHVYRVDALLFWFGVSFLSSLIVTASNSGSLSSPSS